MGGGQICRKIALRNTWMAPIFFVIAIQPYCIAVWFFVVCTCACSRSQQTIRLKNIHIIMLCHHWCESCSFQLATNFSIYRCLLSTSFDGFIIYRCLLSTSFDGFIIYRCLLSTSEFWVDILWWIHHLQMSSVNIWVDILWWIQWTSEHPCTHHL